MIILSRLTFIFFVYVFLHIFLVLVGFLLLYFCAAIVPLFAFEIRIILHAI